MTNAESLILRGLHIMMRATFSPSSPEAQQRHFVAMQQDIGPWFKDYVVVMSGATEHPKVPSDAELHNPNEPYDPNLNPH